MKQLLCFGFGLLLSTIAWSQSTEKGPFVLGGIFDLNLQLNSASVAFLPVSSPIQNFGGNGEDVQAFTLIATPYLGRQISSNWLLGFSLGYGLNHFRDKSLDIVSGGSFSTVDFRRTQHQGTLGLLGRYTFRPEKKLQPFLQPQLTFHYVSQKQEQDQTFVLTNNGYYGELSIAPGVAYLLGEKFRVLARLGGLSYLYGRYETNLDVVGFSVFDLGFNLSSFVLGAEFVL